MGGGSGLAHKDSVLRLSLKVIKTSSQATGALKKIIVKLQEWSTEVINIDTLQEWNTEVIGIVVKLQEWSTEVINIVTLQEWSTEVIGIVVKL